MVLEIHFIKLEQEFPKVSQKSKKMHSKAEKCKHRTVGTTGEDLDEVEKLKDSEISGFETSFVFSELDEVNLNMYLDFNFPLNLSRTFSMASGFEELVLCLKISNSNLLINFLQFLMTISPSQLTIFLFEEKNLSL